MRRPLLAAACFLLVFLSAGPVWAHGDVKRSAPGDGAGLTEVPAEVWIDFTEPPTQQASLTVTDPCGGSVGTGPPVVDGARITLPIAATAKGEYTIRYAIVSRVDGHPSQGAIRFAVARGEKCPPVDPNAAPESALGSEQASTSTVLWSLGLAAAIGAGGGVVLRALTR
ncbi:MAG TPA: copper resistance CopC family protein [Actinomycetota bacterium]|nr:copper resistance CopC family protein [Actinomycetota bacterium]